MKYICRNKECGKFNVVESFNKITSKYSTKYEKVIANEQICKCCGELMDDITEIQEGEINVYFGRIASMTPQQKQQVLKKRSNEHYKTKIRPKKEYLDRSVFGLEK